MADFYKFCVRAGHGGEKFFRPVAEFAMAIYIPDCKYLCIINTVLIYISEHMHLPRHKISSKKMLIDAFQRFSYKFPKKL